MGHGNPLLGGWTLPADGFVTTKLPLLALLERFQGLTPEVVYEVAGLLGAGVVVAGCLARRRPTSRPRPGAGDAGHRRAARLPDAAHPGDRELVPSRGRCCLPGPTTPPPCCSSWSPAWPSRAGRRSWVWPAVAWVALAAASIGDPLAAVVGGGSLTLVGAIGLATRRRARGRSRRSRSGRWVLVVHRCDLGRSPSRSPGGRSARLGGFTAAPLLGGGYGLPAPVASLGSQPLGGRPGPAHRLRRRRDRPAGRARLGGGARFTSPGWPWCWRSWSGCSGPGDGSASTWCRGC